MEVSISCNINGRTRIYPDLSEISFRLVQINPRVSSPIYTIIKSNYPWQHNDVYSTDPKTFNKTKIVYTVDEVNLLVFDKATKTGETNHGNIALLNGIDGDLVDSGIHPNDLFIDIIDVGEF
jgi:hypothetical protein